MTKPYNETTEGESTYCLLTPTNTKPPRENDGCLRLATGAHSACGVMALGSTGTDWSDSFARWSVRDGLRSLVHTRVSESNI